MAQGRAPEGRMLGDRYELRELVGRGGMGLVWEARDTVLHRGVAVKEVTFPQSVTDDERALLCERTFREARAAARVHHPHATTVHDVVEEDGKPWIVMQYVPGRPLSDLVRSDGPLPPTAVARIGIDVLDALRAAHQAGVLHRDVKPANVLVGDDGSACLTDFGIAMSSGDPSITSEGVLLGSPSYMSPERARGDDLTAASDLWSLGATLYFAVEGRPAFDGGGAMATLVAVSVADPAPMEHAGPLGPILLSLLEKAPANRASADELRTALRAVVEGAPDAAVPGPSTAAADRPPSAAAADRVERLDFGQLAQLAAQTATVTGGLAASAARRAARTPTARRVRRWVGVSLLVVAGVAVVLAAILGVAVYEIVAHL